MKVSNLLKIDSPDGLISEEQLKAFLENTHISLRDIQYFLLLYRKIDGFLNRDELIDENEFKSQNKTLESKNCKQNIPQNRCWQQKHSILRVCLRFDCIISK